MTITSHRQPLGNVENLMNSSGGGGRLHECIAPGSLVRVQPRTWPGINKLGGVGRVTKKCLDDGIWFVDVRYILGGSDKHVVSSIFHECSMLCVKSKVCLVLWN